MAANEHGRIWYERACTVDLSRTHLFTDCDAIMSRESESVASLFTQVDISAGATPQSPIDGTNQEQSLLLRQILAALDRQNEVLEEMVTQMSAQQRQRSVELEQWKKVNPELAQDCRRAAETLSRVQNEFLTSLTEEVHENADVLMDGEFMLTEFVDRFGPRLAHLNGVLQVLSQLGGNQAAVKK